VHVEINKNRDGKSKGNGTVQFYTPLQAINAVCILENIYIYIYIFFFLCLRKPRYRY